MTTIDYTEYKCPLCGHTHTTDFMTSTSAFRGPDLDGRPSPLARQTIYLHINECPNCGFASLGIPDSTTVSRDFVESEAYINCEGINFKSDRAKVFYRVFLISKEEGNPYSTLSNLINCAWVCDDDGDEENSINLRVRINELFDSLFDFNDKENDGVFITKIDIMRRAHLFDELIEELKDKTFDESFYTNLCKFQIEKAKEKDAGRYTCDDVEGYHEFRYGR